MPACSPAQNWQLYPLGKYLPRGYTVVIDRNLSKRKGGGGHEGISETAPQGTYLASGGPGAVWRILVRHQQPSGRQRHLRFHPEDEGRIREAVVPVPLFRGGVVLRGVYPGGDGLAGGAVPPAADPEGPAVGHGLRRGPGTGMPVSDHLRLLLRDLGRKLLCRRLPGEKRHLRPAGDGGGAGAGDSVLHRKAGGDGGTGGPG